MRTGMCQHDGNRPIMTQTRPMRRANDPVRLSQVCSAMWLARHATHGDMVPRWCGCCMGACSTWSKDCRI
jgi:hypothetical protein